MKTCKKCNKILPPSSFYKDSRGRDSLRTYCKCCFRKSNKIWRENNPEKGQQYDRKYARLNPEIKNKSHKLWREKNQYKIDAHSKVRTAIRNGKLIRENCFCGKKSHAHHPNYSKPLEVLWLCPIHHSAKHRSA